MTQSPPSVDSASPLGLLQPPHVAVETLENGLTLLVCTDETAPVVSVQFWVETGSIHEGRWLGAGISHLVEHLMFKGTPRRGNSEMAQAIHDLGGRLNAYTSFDRTVYYTDVPVEGWVEATDVLGDAVNHSTFPEEEFEKEKEVIRREFAMGEDDPDRALSKLLFSTVYTRHPYRHPVIGHLDLFNQLTRDDVLAYYRERYSIANQTLIVVGPVEPGTARQEVERLFGEIERRPLPDIVLPDEPECQAPRTRRQSFPTQLTRLSQLYPVPGIAHADVPALDVLAVILGEGRSSRLHQRIVEQEGWAEEIDAYVYAPSSTGLWGIDARLQPEKEDALLAAINEEIQRARHSEPTAEEVARAIRSGLTTQLRSQKTMRGQAASFGRGWLTDRNPLLSHAYLQRLALVTSADVQRVAHHYLIEPHRNLMVLAGEQDAAKTESTEADAAQASTYRTAEKLPLTAPLRGVQVKAAELPLCALRLTLPGSLLDEAPELAGINRLASQLLLKGTRQRNAAQLASDIEQLGGRFFADSGNNSTALGVELLRADIGVGLNLIIEILSELEPTESELATEKRKQLAALQEEEDHPLQVASRTLRETLYPGLPYGHTVLGSAESVERITIKDIQRHLQSHVFTQEMVVALSGDYASPHTWLTPLEDNIAKLPAKETRIEELKAVELTEPQRVEKHMDKQQAVLALAYPTVPVTHPDRLLLDLLDEALSDLGSRLFIRIREEMGLAYFVGTSQFPGRAAGYFLFYLGTDPQKRQEVEAVLLDEIQNLATKGLTETEFNRARAKILAAHQFQTQNANQLAYTASLDELFGLGYDFSQQQIQRLEGLPLEEVNAAAARYFLPHAYVLAVVSPN